MEADRTADRARPGAPWPALNRRRWLLTGLGGGAALVAGAGLWLRGTPEPVASFGDWTTAYAWLDDLEQSPASTRSGWSLSVVLQHLAQSIEYSIDGYPQMQPAWFQASIGALASRAFQRAGRMHHDLQAPIPGAPALEEIDKAAAALRLRVAMQRFERHRGRLQPHFAYGELDHMTYARAHWMHLADHAQLITSDGAIDARA